MTAAATRAPRAWRRISFVRVMIVLGIVLAVAALGVRWAFAIIAEVRKEPETTWFAPYVDVTLTPTLHFEDPSEQPADDVVLAFIVADPVDRCAPSWGTYYDLDAAARALDLDRRIVRLRERGGDAIVSFGGALNDELATVCRDVDDLVEAYQSVIDRYSLTAVDFDIEGAALGDTTANGRRADAIRRLQEANPGLAVWFTLPVAPFGLTAEGVALIDQAIAAGVRLAGVNVMTMNYGGSREAGASMGTATTAALMATFQQMDGAYQRAGQPRSQAEIWAMIGATPMIGQNDVAADVFTLGDAHTLMGFAAEVGLARVSSWSANRDVACGAAVDDNRVSNTCSGVGQDPLAFARIFGSAGTARPGERPQTEPPGESRADSMVRDDPRTSPYPIWRAAKAYVAESKVVWQGRVYQAKWWTQGDQPDAPVKNTWDTPWRYLGPVLESDRDAVRAAKPVVDGEYPRWSAERVFVAGDVVEDEGQVFRAKWWTQGDNPQEDPDQPYDHPWEYLGEARKADVENP